MATVLTDSGRIRKMFNSRKGSLWNKLYELHSICGVHVLMVVLGDEHGTIEGGWAWSSGSAKLPVVNPELLTERVRGPLDHVTVSQVQQQTPLPQQTSLPHLSVQEIDSPPPPQRHMTESERLAPAAILVTNALAKSNFAPDALVPLEQLQLSPATSDHTMDEQAEVPELSYSSGSEVFNLREKYAEHIEDDMDYVKPIPPPRSRVLSRSSRSLSTRPRSTRRHSHQRSSSARATSRIGRRGLSRTRLRNLIDEAGTDDSLVASKYFT